MEAGMCRPEMCDIFEPAMDGRFKPFVRLRVSQNHRGALRRVLSLSKGAKKHGRFFASGFRAAHTGFQYLMFLP